MNGEACEPENREGLYVFDLPEPLPPGASCAIGFEFEGVFLDGFYQERRGEQRVHRSLGRGSHRKLPSFVPVVGYQEGSASTRTTDYDAREYPDDFYEGVTHAAFGPDVRRTRAGFGSPRRRSTR